MDKDWQARFDASEQRPRSTIAQLYLLDLLGSFGLAVFLVIIAVRYLKQLQSSRG